jgi:glycosyltransferase involved in cell wall biosynthesis
MERLRQRVVETGLGDCVHLLGWRDDVHDLLSCFSVFTMSSRSEGTSVSLLEAMSSGLCPVVTRVGGNPEVLGPELEHGLVPSESPAALARVWADVLSDPVRLETDGARARARVEERYSLRRMVDEYVSVYTGEGA